MNSRTFDCTTESNAILNNSNNNYKLKLKRTTSMEEKKILLSNIKMGTREWARREINCIKGCRMYCLYCYAKGIAKHYKRCTEETWKNMEINSIAVDKNYSKVRKKGSQPYDIMFPTSHNIILDEPYFSACTIVLKKLLEADNSVLVTVKPSLKVVKKLCKLFQDYKETMTYRFTIGSTSSKILKILEINAPTFEERLESLQYATVNGFNTSISIEPLLDSTPFKLIERLEPYLSPLNYERDIGTIWIGLLKTQYIPIALRTGEIKEFIKFIKPQLKFEHVYQYYEILYNHPRIKWKESIIKMMILNDVKTQGITS